MSKSVSHMRTPLQPARLRTRDLERLLSGGDAVSRDLEVLEKTYFGAILNPRLTA
jgi:hypothetical protein